MALAADWIVRTDTKGQFMHSRLAQYHRPGRFQPLHNEGILVRHHVLEMQGARRGAHTGALNIVLDGHG